MFGDYSCGLRQFSLLQWTQTQSIYKHKIHQTYHQNLEVQQ